MSAGRGVGRSVTTSGGAAGTPPPRALLSSRQTLLDGVTDQSGMSTVLKQGRRGAMMVLSAAGKTEARSQPWECALPPTPQEQG